MSQQQKVGSVTPHQSVGEAYSRCVVCAGTQVFGHCGRLALVPLSLVIFPDGTLVLVLVVSGDGSRP
ncbi:MAG: hypothetical protein R3E60_02130 [Alphaproteobacteria bacterium]